jgi:hypothetical protein
MKGGNVKDISGYEGIYAASKDGAIYSYRSQKFLKPASNGMGYLHINLCFNGYVKTGVIHRLIAETFIKNPLSLSEVNHKNGIKSDNKKTNLEWVDHDQNIRHANDTGLFDKNIQRKHAFEMGKKNIRYVDSMINEIRREYANGGITQRALGIKYGMTFQNINLIVNNKSRRQIV